MEIDVLGTFAVRREGEDVGPAEFGGRRVRQLVRMLVSVRGQVLSRDTLIEELWGDQAPADPAANLNVIVNRARRALGGADVIRTVPGGYLLADGPSIAVDADRFAQHVEEARGAAARAEPEHALDAARTALALWGEPYVEDACSEWARPHRDRLERLHQEALETAAAQALLVGRGAEAVDFARQAVARQPLREAAHLLLIRAAAADGDHAAAITAYLDLRTMLADELGVDPTPEATELYEQLLRNQGPVRRGAGSTRAARGLPPLVGRERDLAALAQLGPRHRTALVAGRSGWGKSRLLFEATTAAAVDRSLFEARALLAERDEPWSLVRSLLQSAAALRLDVASLLGDATRGALQEVVGDLLGDLPRRAPASDPESARAMARQGVVRLLEAAAPALVVVDDLQWADSSSLDVLAALAERTSDCGLLLAYRPEEVSENSPVARFLSVVAESRPLRVSLEPLGPAALVGLVRSSEVAAALADNTDGTPFAVLQVLHALEGEGLLRPEADGTWSVADPAAHTRVAEVARAGQREAAWRQYERQPSPARELLGCLALMGRPAPLRLLSAASELTREAAMDRLRDLARAHLVRHEPDGFRCHHDVIAETIRDRLDAVDRTRLHERLAAVLASDESAADELARHLEGAGDRVAAAAAYAEAARSHLRAHANAEASRLAARGLSLGPTDPGIRGTLLEAHAEALARQHDLAGAREGIREALQCAARPADRARLLARLSALTAGADDMVRAGALADLALAEAGDDVTVRGRALFARAVVDMNRGETEAALRGYAAALDDFRAAGDAFGMAEVADARAMAAFGEGDIAAGVGGFEHAAHLFTDSGNLLRAVVPWSGTSHALTFAGRATEAVPYNDRAWELARTLGFADGEALVLWHRGEVLAACGRAEEGRKAADEGVSIARALGHRGWTATTLRARGICELALDDLAAARSSLEDSLRTSGEHLIMFASWARSQLALTHLRLGDLDRAAEYVERALGSGPGLAQYEARLARCELAVRRGDPDSGRLVDDALARARTGGHLLSAARLATLRDELS